MATKSFVELEAHSISCESRVSGLQVYETYCDKVGADFEHRGVAWFRATSSGLMYCYQAAAVMGITEHLIAFLARYILKQVSNVGRAFWDQQEVLNTTLGSGALEMFTSHWDPINVHYTKSAPDCWNTSDRQTSEDVFDGWTDLLARKLEENGGLMQKHFIWILYDDFQPYPVVFLTMHLFLKDTLVWRFADTQGSISQVKLCEPWRNGFGNHAFGIVIWGLSLLLVHSNMLLVAWLFNWINTTRPVGTLLSFVLTFCTGFTSESRHQENAINWTRKTNSDKSLPFVCICRDDLVSFVL